MFKDFTEKARRAIYFTRQETIRNGSSEIEVEDFLIGLLREDNNLLPQVLESDVDSLRTEIEGRITRQKSFQNVVNLPLSAGARKVLANAVDESRTLSHKRVTTAHILLGLLREPAPFMDGIFLRYNL